VNRQLHLAPRSAGIAVIQAPTMPAVVHPLWPLALGLCASGLVVGLCGITLRLTDRRMPEPPRIVPS
jgi:hypothetical protein